MTAPRGKIEVSLAERGRPAMWANEQEAAVLSGVSKDTFVAKVKSWEKRGFPQVNLENGKRPIPGILAFWALPSNHLGAMTAVGPSEDQDGEENWNGQPNSSQRRAS